MASFKRYFSYQLKKSLPQLITILLISLLFTILFTKFYLVLAPNVFNSYTNVTFTLPFVMITLCIVIPIIELAPFKNRRNLDTLMFLPVSRLKMSIAHYLNGLIQIVGVFLICSIYTFFFLLKKINGFAITLGEIKVPFSLGYFMPYLIFNLLFGIAIYSIFMFILSTASTLIDGIIFMFFYSVGFKFVALAIKRILQSFIKLKFLNTENFIIFNPLTDLSSYYKKMMVLDSPNLSTFDYTTFVMWGIFGISSIFGFIFTFKNQKVEQIGDISTTLFGYKVLIPVIIYSLMILTDISLNFIIQLLLIISMYVGYIIFRRSVKLKKPDYICIASSIAPIILSAIVN